MKVALIPPIAHLKEFCQGRSYQLVLPHLVKSSVEYRNFYRDDKEAYLILDNGEAEGVTTPAYELLDIAAALNVNEIVVPDVLGSTFDTIDRARAFEPYARKHPEFNYMGVVQGKSVHEIVQCLTWMSLQPWINIVALPRILNKIEPTMRVCILHKYAKQLDDGFEQVHCLGMSINLTEPLKLHETSVRSLDTSLPFSLAIGKKSFGEGVYIPRQENYFDDRFLLSSSQQWRAHQNVIQLDKMAVLGTLEGYMS